MEQTRKLMVLRRRVEGWRRDGGGRGSRIPEVLWNEAVAIARQAGLYATARALRFNYEGLKKRAAKSGGKENGNKAAFVALQLPAFNGGARVVVDLVGRDGEQVRIDSVGASGMDVVAFAQAFWGRRS
jgi:hypothetical protein